MAAATAVPHYNPAEQDVASERHSEVKAVLDTDGVKPPHTPRRQNTPPELQLSPQNHFITVYRTPVTIASFYGRSLART
jgi:hypothetical protein